MRNKFSECIQIESQIHFFLGTFVNCLRTSSYDELFCTMAENSRRNLETSGANNERSQSSHHRIRRHLSSCSSGCLCCTCKHRVPCSCHVWQDKNEYGEAQPPQRFWFPNGDQGRRSSNDARPWQTGRLES